MIKEVNGKSVTVEYIDYGNSEHLSIDRVKVLGPDFDGAPRFALQCCFPNHQQLQSSSLKDTLLEQEFNADFKSKEAPFHVVLYTADGTRVGSVMEQKPIDPVTHVDIDIAPPDVAIDIVPLDEAIDIAQSDVAVNKASPDVVIDIDIGNDVGAFHMVTDVGLYKESVEVGSSHNMYFLEATSPHEFYCQPVVHEEDLAVLMVNIASYVQAGNTPKFRGKIGDCGLAVYKEDGAWYRVKVLEVVKKNVS